MNKNNRSRKNVGEERKNEIKTFWTLARRKRKFIFKAAIFIYWIIEKNGNTNKWNRLSNTRNIYFFSSHIQFQSSNDFSPIFSLVSKSKQFTDLFTLQQLPTVLWVVRKFLWRSLQIEWATQISITFEYTIHSTKETLSGTYLKFKIFWVTFHVENFSSGFCLSYFCSKKLLKLKFVTWFFWEEKKRERKKCWWNSQNINWTNWEALWTFLVECIKTFDGARINAKFSTSE